MFKSAYPTRAPSQDNDDWLATAAAALLAGCPDEDDDDDEEPDDDDAPESFRARHLPEYRTRLLAIATACAGWTHAAVTPLYPWLDYASDCFEREALDPWRAALSELERYVGVAALREA